MVEKCRVAAIVELGFRDGMGICRGSSHRGIATDSGEEKRMN